jgi:hypothetical protein
MLGMNEPVNPRREPEIFPPGAPLPRGSHIRVAIGGQRVYATPLSPITLGLVGLAVGVGATIGVIVLLGLLALSLVSVGFLAIGFVIAGILRKANQPLR